MSALKGLRVHVEGMGITGSLLAYHLESWGCNWTWHDADAPATAWKASTGAIFPAGKPGSLDWECWRVWAEWLNGKSPYPRQHFEPARYWFNHVQPPHHGSYEFFEAGKHGLKHAGPTSFHLNAQTFVPATRRRFKARNLERVPRYDVYVIAHGFSQRLHHVVWGWTVPVKLKLPHYMCDSLRPAVYLRKGRFVMAYAYPIPGTEFWYAGSSLIRQPRPAELEVELKLLRWKENFEELSGGALKVTEARLDGALQGWRPAEADPHCEPKVKAFAGKRLAVPPLWHSGIRHFPRVLQQLQAELGRVRAG